MSEQLVFTASDLAGSIHRRLYEAAAYIHSSNAMAINVEALVEQLDGTRAFLNELARMQAQMQQAQAAE